METAKWGLEQESKKLDQKLDNFKQFEIENNDTKCEQLMKTKLKKYDKVYQEFKHFFDGNAL